MANLREGTGFGFYDFGDFPFGEADFGEDTIVRSFAGELLEDEDDPDGINQLLLHYLQAVKDRVNEIKSDIDGIDNQVDFNTVREDLLVYLGQTINVTIDDAEPVEFQRSLVGGAIQFYRIKGTEQSYRIRGKISGFDVDVLNLFKINPVFIPFFDPVDIFELPAGSGIYYTDKVPGEVPGTPTEVSCDYCLTSGIKISFTIVKSQPPSVIGAPNLFDRLVFKLRDIIPIHVTDLLYEIVANIVVDEHSYIDANLYLSEEETFTPCMVGAYFDVISADVMPMDGHLTVSGTSEVEAA